MMDRLLPPNRCSGVAGTTFLQASREIENMTTELKTGSTAILPANVR